MLSDRQQRQRIYAVFAGGDTDPERHNPEDYSEPWRTVLGKLTWFYQAHMDHVGKVRRDGTDWRTYYHDDIVDCLAPAARFFRTHPYDVISILADAGKVRKQWQNMAQIAPTLPPITWLWEGWIPRGLLTLLGATPKTGKSWLALDLARMVINGGTWPDGQAVGHKGQVVWVEAEAVAQITRDRAQMVGIDLNRFWPIVPPVGDIIDLSMASTRDDLIELVQHVKPSLIVIDSLSGVLSKGENNIEDVRRMLAFLVGLAAEYDAGLVLIHHIKKLDRAQLALPGISLYDFRGSGHITAVARSIIGLSVQSPANGPIVTRGPRRMEVVAATLCETPEPLGMTIESTDDQLRIVYGEAPEVGKAKSLSSQCRTWLLDLLAANGPMKPKDIVELAEAEGFERSMVMAARASLEADGRLRRTKGANNPRSEWALADDAAADDIDDD
jgi:hypothetical protein